MKKIETDIREYVEEMPVNIIILQNRIVIEAFNEGGYNRVNIDLFDIVKWVLRPEIYNEMFKAIKEENKKLKKELEYFKQPEGEAMSNTKYEHIGDPAIRVLEEIGELVQAICKGERFGWDNHHPDRTLTNTEELWGEWCDLRDKFTVFYNEIKAGQRQRLYKP